MKEGRTASAAGTARLRRAVSFLPAPAFLLAGLLFSLPAFGGLSSAGATQSQGPLIPRAQMMTVAEVRPGMKGIGKSVFAGTRIQDFGVTILGVLRRVDFGGDIILVRIDSGPPVTKGYGVVGGMSGSPVYVQGKLIGALAYTWPFAKRPIAGVTPIAQMLEAFQPGSSSWRKEGTLAATRPFVIDGQSIERATLVPTGSPSVASRSGGMTLTPIATPLMVSGVNPSMMPWLETTLAPLGLTPVSGAGSMSHINTRIAPGAAVGARLMAGDLDITAIGTVTHVSKGVVLAFGHTLSSLGSADIPLVATYVHGVMASAELSFKLASGGQTLGAFTEDRPWCMGGRLGDRARLVHAMVKVMDQDRNVTRDYGLQVIRNRTLTSSLLTSAMIGAIRSVGPPSEGTTRVTFSLKAEGLPPLTRQNTYAVEEAGGLLSMLFGPQAAVASATDELNQILDALQNSEFGEAKLSRLAVTVELSKRRRVARLERLLADRYKVKPGEEVQITALLRAANRGLITWAHKIPIPESCPPGRVQIGVAGGRSAEWLRSRLEVSEPRPESLTQMVKQMVARPSNDQLVVQVALPTVGVEARGLRLRDLPPAVMEVLRSSPGTKLRPLRDHVERRERTEWMISGYGVVSLLVEGDEKDKGGRPPSPQYGPFMFEEVSPGLAGLFSGFGISTGARPDQMRASSDGRLRRPIKMLGAPEAPPEDEVQMPSWEEVSAVGEGEVVTSAAAGEPTVGPSRRGEAMGRPASVWRLSTENDFSKGKTEGVAVVNTGGLVLAPKASIVGKVAAQCLWPIAVTADGSVYTGAWSDGRLWRTTPEGETSVALETEDAAVQAVTIGLDGAVYAATMPGGRIYRIKMGEKPSVLCKLSAPDIWALAATQGALWAATGPEGKLFRITADGHYSLAFTAADRHIVALAQGADSTLYLATAPRGKIYAVAPDGRARSICEVEKSSLQSIAVDGKGNIFVGTSPDGRVLRINADGSLREILKAKGRHVLALLAAPDGLIYAAAGPTGKIYAIYPDQTWAEVYDSRSAFLAGMTIDAAGVMYATTADTGQIIKLVSATQRAGRFTSPVRDAGASALWGAARWWGHPSDSAGLTVWARSGETAHPDSTWSAWQPVSKGSENAVSSSRRRFLQCRVEFQSSGPATPKLEAIEFSYLPANQAPEVTWSVPKGGEIWSGKKTVRWSGRDPDNDRLSYELFWSADGGRTWTKIETPAKAEAEKQEKQDQEEKSSEGRLRRPVERRGAPQAPNLGGGAQTSRPAPTEANLAPLKSAQVVVPAQGLGRGEPANRKAGAGEPGEEEESAPMRSRHMGGGEAESEDRGEEQPEKSELEREQPSPSALTPSATTSLVWDTTQVSDGVYLLKTVGSDRISNPADPRQAEVVSRPFIVDNTAPELILDRERKDNDQPPGEVEAFDRTTYITGAEFRIDNGEWKAAMAKDGIFDEQLEAVLLDEARIPTGSHQIEIRARDASGNAATQTLRYARQPQ